MHFIIDNGEVQCPACGLRLHKISEQDRRVHVMHHPPTAICNVGGKRLRVDRYNGYGEVQNNA